ncbi:unnamed protein product [Lampetra fluviatilis]
MDSVVGDDPSLPGDLSSLSRLHELTGVEPGGLLGMELGVEPGGPGGLAGGTQISPTRARTMKDYEQQIAELKKENFSLKLRIYFLEERVQEGCDGATEDVYRTNIELKVEVESLKRDLREKQNLLVKASNAVETLAGSREAEISRLHQQARQEMQQLHGQLRKLQEELEQGREELGHMARLAQAERERGLELEAELGELRASHQQQLQQLQLQQQSSLSPPPYQPQGQQQQQLQQLAHGREAHTGRRSVAVGPNDSSSNNNSSSSSSNNNALNSYSGRMQSHELQEKLAETASELRTQEQNALKRDRAIQGLSLAMKAKDKEISELCEELENRDAALVKARDATHKAQLQKFHGAEEQHALLTQKEEELCELRAATQRSLTETQRAQRALRRADERLADATAQRDSAEEEKEGAMLERQRAERGMQELRSELEHAKRERRERELELVQEHESHRRDCEHRLASHELLVRRLTDSLADRDRLLQEYTELLRGSDQLPDGKGALIAALQQRLNEQHQLLERADEARSAALQHKEAEIVELRRELAERSRDLERLRALLAGKDETIQGLDELMRERDAELQRLASALKETRRARDEAGEALDGSLADAERARALLAQRETELEAARQALLQRAEVGAQELVRRLTERLADKERLLEQALSEGGRPGGDAPREGRRLAELLAQLRDKEECLEAERAERARQQREMEQLRRRLAEAGGERWTEREGDAERVKEGDPGRETLTHVELGRLHAVLQEKDSIIHQLALSLSDRSQSFISATLISIFSNLTIERGTSTMPLECHYSIRYVHGHGESHSRGGRKYTGCGLTAQLKDLHLANQELERKVGERELANQLASCRLDEAENERKQMEDEVRATRRRMEEVEAMTRMKEAEATRRRMEEAEEAPRETTQSHRRLAATRLEEVGAQNDELERELEGVTACLEEEGFLSFDDLREELRRLRRSPKARERKEGAARITGTTTEDVDTSRKPPAPEPAELVQRLSDAERVNELLRRQLEMNTSVDGDSSFNPDLIVGMACEIERLNAELDVALPTTSAPCRACTGVRQHPRCVCVAGEASLACKGVQVEVQDLGYETCGRSEAEDYPGPGGIARHGSRDAISPAAGATAAAAAAADAAAAAGDAAAGAVDAPGLRRQVEDLNAQLGNYRQIVRELQARQRGRDGDGVAASADVVGTDGVGGHRHGQPKAVARSDSCNGSDSAQGSEHDGDGTPSSGTPRSPAVTRLMGQVGRLEEQLHDTKRLNRQLKEQLRGLHGKRDSSGSAGEGPRLDSLVQAQARDLSELRQRLRLSARLCGELRERLCTLTKALEELLSSGDVDYYAGEGVRKQLGRTAHLMDKLLSRINSVPCTVLLCITGPVHRTWRRLEEELLERDRLIEDLQQQLSSPPPSPSACDDRFLRPRSASGSGRSSHSRSRAGSTSGSVSGSDGSVSGSAPRSWNRSCSLSSERDSLDRKSLAEEEDGDSFQDHYNPARGPGERYRDDQRRAAPGAVPAAAAVAAAAVAAAVPRGYHSDAEVLNRGPCGYHGNGLAHSLSGFGSADVSFEQRGYHSDTGHAGLAAGHHASHHALELLEEHLREIRALRRRLEESILTNEQLRRQLEQRLADSEHDAGSEEEAVLREALLRKTEELEQLGVELDASRSQLAQRQSELDAARAAGERLRRELEETRARAGEETRRASAELERADRERAGARAELERGLAQAREAASELEGEVGWLKQQLGEAQQVVTSLKVEMKVQEHKKAVLSRRRSTDALGHDAGARPPTPDAVTLAELLAEMRALRRELERGIQANQALRLQLQAQLWHGERAPPPPPTTAPSPAAPASTININYIGSGVPRLKGGKSSTPHPEGSKAFWDAAGGHVIALAGDYDALRQRVAEGRLLIRGMDSRIRDCLNTLAQHVAGRKTSDVATVRELRGNVSAMQQLLEEAAALLQLFWRAALPPTAPAGAPTTHTQGGVLSDEVTRLRRKLTEQESLLQSTVSRLRTSNQRKDSVERAIIKQLTRTHEVLKKARGNLEPTQVNPYLALGLGFAPLMSSAARAGSLSPGSLSSGLSRTWDPLCSSAGNSAPSSPELAHSPCHY